MSKILKLEIGIVCAYFLSGCVSTGTKNDNLDLAQKASATRSSEEISNESKEKKQSSQQKMKSNLEAIIVENNSAVTRWKHYFKTKAPRTISQWMSRSEPYRNNIMEILEAEGVPKEFFYLALVESGFNNHAYSPAKARGPWQFVKSTAQIYGLRINRFLDERCDPVKSTRAAAAYLRDLQRKFGDWHLVMAAYNSGPRTIEKAMQRVGAKNFWDLSRSQVLKRETHDFVPKVLAVISIGSELAQNKVTDEMTTKPLSVVLLKRSLNLHELAKELSVQVSQIKNWNPELLGEHTPPMKFSPENGYVLHLPDFAAKKFELIEPKLSHRSLEELKIHRVVRGDTLSKLAKRYRVSVKEVLQVNPNLKSQRMTIGMRLTVPAPDSTT